MLFRPQSAGHELFPAGMRIRAAFTSPQILTDEAIAIVNLSANIPMDACADVAITLYRTAVGGTSTAIGAGSLLNQSIPRSTSGGTGGFAPFLVPVELGASRNIGAGEAVSLGLTVTNHCSNRGVTLVYDGTTALSRLEIGYESCLASQQTTVLAVNASWPGEAALGGATLLISYPPEVSIPGVETHGSVAQRASWTSGGTHIARDLNDAIILTTLSIAGIGTHIANVTFDVCQGATAPAIADYDCSVIATANTGGTAVTGATCTLAIQ